MHMNGMFRIQGVAYISLICNKRRSLFAVTELQRTKPCVFQNNAGTLSNGQGKQRTVVFFLTSYGGSLTSYRWIILISIQQFQTRLEFYDVSLGRLIRGQ